MSIPDNQMPPPGQPQMGQPQMGQPQMAQPQMGQTDFAPGTAPVQGPAGRYRVGLTKVTSMILLTQRRSAVYTGTLEQLEKAAQSAMIHNLTLGWWGFPFGLIWTPIALARNASNMKKIRALAAGRQV